MGGTRGALRIVVVGHVDHGKSTLIGRILQDTGRLSEERIAALREMSQRRGMPFELSFLTDALQTERDQGITIDASQVRFHTDARDYVLVDAPGHKAFIKNMVTGASTADAAVLVIDAAEGVSEQTRRHAYLLSLLGIRRLVVAINKMDAVGYRETRFRAVAEAIGAYLSSIDLTADAILPISAREGIGVAALGPELPWFDGPTLLAALDALPGASSLADQPLRLPIQDIYKFDERRILVGRIESGRLRVGDRLRFSPSGASARVASIEGWNAAPQLAVASGASVGFTLDDDIFVERGDVASHGETAPVVSRRFRARIFWLAAEKLGVGDRVTLRLGTAEHVATIATIERLIDIDSLATLPGAALARNDVAEIVLTSRALVALDERRHGAALARGVLTREGAVVAGCLIEAALDEAAGAGAAPNLTASLAAVPASERAARNGHAGGIVWLTGLSGAGKSTLARRLERQLFDLGYQVAVLDGDNLRQSLNTDLGFSPADRSENVRRIGEVAGILSETGVVALVACIAPRRAARERLRARFGDRFSEIYVKASLAACAARDPKGLYAKAEGGEIAAFTGVSAPYEEPLAPDLVIDTEALTAEEAALSLLDLVADRYGGRDTAVRDAS